MRSKLIVQLFLILGLAHISLMVNGHQMNNADVNRKLLGTIKRYMDASVDPCEDFYRYACGNWERVHRNASKYVDAVSSLDYFINQKVKALLKGKKFKRKSKTNLIYQKLALYHRTCENQTKFDAKYYLDIIKPMNNTDWPQVDDHWRPKKGWSIWLTLGRLHAVGFNGFPLTLDLKPRNSTTFQLELNKMELLGYTAYEQRLLDVMEDSLNVKTRKLAEKLQQFNNQLLLLHKSEKEFGSREMSISELQNQYEKINFLDFFSQFLETDRIASTTIVVGNLGFFKKLGDLIAQTSNETLIHMVKLKFLGYLEKLMPRTESDFTCLNHMRDLVPLALDFLYEQEVFRYDRNISEVVIRRIFRNMQDTFKQIIEEHANEISSEDIKFLQMKIKKMQLNVGNLPLVRGHQFYFHYFRNWKVMADNFYWNHLSALHHYFKEIYKLLHLKSYSPYHTFLFWPYGSPAYQPSKNLLIIPHAYLRYPIFHPKFHDLFLYAELGNALGHEMLHAFDMNGLKYDALGNPSMQFLSTLMDNTKFLRNLQCLEEQRQSSLNEQIADFSGFHLAYQTYFNGQNNATKFKGTTLLSNKQLFFIKFAQFFCAISSSHISYDDSHETPFRRVPQVVVNHWEFEEVFACPPKTGRKQVKKCQLW